MKDSEVRSMIERLTGETGNLLMIVRSRMLKKEVWTCKQTTRYIDERYLLGKSGGVKEEMEAREEQA